MQKDAASFKHEETSEKFERLPAIVLQRVISFLELPTLAMLLLTSKILAKIIVEDECLWKLRCKKDFGEDYKLPGISTFFHSYTFPPVQVAAFKERLKDLKELGQQNFIAHEGLTWLCTLSKDLADIDADSLSVSTTVRCSFSYSKGRELDLFPRLCRIMQHPFLVSVEYLEPRPSRYVDDKLFREFVPGCECIFDRKTNLPALVAFYGAQLVLVLEHLAKWGLTNKFRSLFDHDRVMVGKDHYLKIHWFSIYQIGADEYQCGYRQDSVNYISPEVLTCVGEDGSLFWGLGVFLFELFTGVTPFEAETLPETFENILDQEPDLTKVSKCSPAGADLISQLLDKKVAKRLTDLATIKKHPFFQDISWDDILAKKISTEFLCPGHSLTENNASIQTYMSKCKNFKPASSYNSTKYKGILTESCLVEHLWEDSYKV